MKFILDYSIFLNETSYTGYSGLNETTSLTTLCSIWANGAYRSTPMSQNLGPPAVKLI